MNLLSEDTTKEKLLYENTLFPIYEPFLFEEEQQVLREKMYGDGGLGIKGQIGFLAGSIMKKEHFYYCSKCVEEDMLNLEESYFRVVHQFQGSLVCEKHNVLLEKYPITQKSVGRVAYIRLDETLLGNINSRINTNEHILELSKMVKQISEGMLSGFHAQLLKDLYLKKLEKKQQLTIGSEVKYVEMISDLNEFYKDNFLKSMESEIDPNFESNWLRKLLRTKRVKVHPIRHLMVIRLLFGTLEELVAYSKQVPVKDIYPCLNKVCNSFKELIIYNVTITADYKTRVPVGTFKCPCCGFTYSRKMSDEPYNIGRVKEFGDSFIQELSRISRIPDMSLRAKARHMGCDTGTIKKYSK